MGKQSSPFHRHRWRAGLGHAAERVGSDLANPEANHFVDERQCGERNSGAGESFRNGADVFRLLADQCISLASLALLHGCRQPLSDVWKVTEGISSFNGCAEK